MHTSFRRLSPLLGLALATTIVVAACHGATPFEVAGAPSRSFSVAVGENITISIGGVGPSYASPPTITGSAIQFLDMTNPPTTVVTPGGAVQLYHFKGVTSGQAIITFENQVFPIIVDTVTVR